MQEDFNPYVAWLGLPEGRQPATHYELLGLNPFESDAALIAKAADAMTNRLRAVVPGPQLWLWQELLSQLGRAKACLLDSDSKAAYDAALRGQQHPVATCWPAAAPAPSGQAMPVPTGHPAPAWVSAPTPIAAAEWTRAAVPTSQRGTGQPVGPAGIAIAPANDAMSQSWESSEPASVTICPASARQRPSARSRARHRAGWTLVLGAGLALGALGGLAVHRLGAPIADEALARRAVGSFTAATQGASAEQVVPGVNGANSARETSDTRPALDQQVGGKISARIDTSRKREPKTALPQAKQPALAEVAMAGGPTGRDPAGQGVGDEKPGQTRSEQPRSPPSKAGANEPKPQSTGEVAKQEAFPVSYTHLTLPTIYSV